MRSRRATAWALSRRRPNRFAGDVAAVARESPVPVLAAIPDYLIGAEDVLSIVFWRDKEMSSEVVVRYVHVATHEWSDFKAARPGEQIPPTPLLRQSPNLALGVATDLGSRQRAEGHVGGDHLPVAMTTLVKEHRDAVRLLAVAATGAPHRMRFFACLSSELSKGNELRWVPKEAAVLNGDSVEQIIKRGRFVVEDVDVGAHGDAREVRAFLKQPLQPGAACGLVFESCSRAEKQRGLVERIDCRQRVAFSELRPSSRETALSKPASSNDVLTM